MTAEKCPVLIHYNFYSYRCDRPVKRSGKCGIHARADEARAESDRQRAAEREGSESRMQAAERAIAELADHGIAASPAYRGREAGYTGGVELNAAATQALLGQLDAAEAALARVRELHERESFWQYDRDQEHIYQTQQEAADESGCDCPDTSVPFAPFAHTPECLATITHFDVCSECARIERADADRQAHGEFSGYAEALRPCPTVAAIGGEQS